MPDNLRTYALTQEHLASHAGEQMLFLADDAHLVGRSYPLSAERPACYVLHAKGQEPRLVRATRADGSPPDSDRVPGMVSTVASVAVVSVMGPLMQRASAPGPCSEYVMGYDSIAESYCAAHAGPADSVTMLFDSPGGVVPGLFPALSTMKAAKDASGKPVVGHMGPQCGSAAYAIAAALCDTLVLSASGYAGSIGCRGGTYNKSAANEKAGIAFTAWGWPPPPDGEEASGKLANHPDMPPTALGNMRGSRDVADAGQMFGEMVAAARGDRGLDMAKILSLHADMLRGQAAVDAGLADMLGEEADALSLAMAKAVERRGNAAVAAPPLATKPPPDDGDEDEDDTDEDEDSPPPSPPPPAQPQAAFLTGDHPMKLAAFAALVGLGADAAEPSILAALTPIAGLAKATLKAAGTADPEDARAWVKRAGQALTEEPARVKALADANATAERADRFRLGDDLVAKGYKPGDVFLYAVEGETATNPGTKVRAGLVPEYAAPSVVNGEEIGMTLGTLRGFVRRAPALASNGLVRGPTDSPFEPVIRRGSTVSATDPAVIERAQKAGVTAEAMAASMAQMDAAFSEEGARR